MRYSPHLTLINSIKDLAESELEDPFKLIENERTGRIEVGEKNLQRVFNEMVAKPCKYFKDLFGPDVVEPVLFDSMFGHQVESNKVKFYEALVKYRLCYLNGSAEKSAKKFIGYGQDGLQ